VEAITFIGGGNMATALIAGLTKNNWKPDAIHVLEIDPAARQRLAREFNVHVHEKAGEALAASDCIVLAVKPQHLQAVARKLYLHLGNQLVISIAAGIRCADLARWLRGHSRVVRAMPNTPALALAGVTGLYAPPSVSVGDRGLASRILGVAGVTLWVDREEEMDAVTAVSGSGPAYVFYFIEALQEAAVELGLDKAVARSLALETFSGAVKLAAESSDSTETLRARVTSKGGTTERGIEELDRQRVKAAITRAVAAAAERSRELGDALARDDDDTRPS
jgi:pyrroline-5-carboxylate reductase